MQVPLLDLKREYLSLKSRLDAAIHEVVKSQQFILGYQVKAFEEELADYCGVKHAIGVASGTDALLLSLRALGIGPGDKVIVPSFTFFATAGVVCNVGAEPVFADIDPQTYNIDPGHVRELLSDRSRAEKIKAIIPVHLYGQMADMDEIMALAKEHELHVIEDAAQAIGAEYKGRKAGTVGNCGCFSFFPTKNLGAYGDGGMVVTNNDDLAKNVRMLRVHGAAQGSYYHDVVGYNSRLSALQAAVLRAKLPFLKEWSENRKSNANYYNEKLSSIASIVTPAVAEDRTHIYHQYTVRIRNGRRDELQHFLEEKGIETRVYYPLALHLQKCFRSLGYTEGDFYEAERASKEVLSLPIFPELTQVEKDYVVSMVSAYFKE